MIAQDRRISEWKWEHLDGYFYRLNSGLIEPSPGKDSGPWRIFRARTGLETPISLLRALMLLTGIELVCFPGQPGKHKRTTWEMQMGVYWLVSHETLVPVSARLEAVGYLLVR